MQLHQTSNDCLYVAMVNLELSCPWHYFWAKLLPECQIPILAHGHGLLVLGVYLDNKYRIWN